MKTTNSFVSFVAIIVSTLSFACVGNPEHDPDAAAAAGSAGSAGTAGSSGTSGTAGTGGTAGSAGTAGAGGSSGTAGTAGSAGSGNAGSGGSSGSSGSAGSAGTGAAGAAGTGATAGNGGAAGTGNVCTPTTCPAGMICSMGANNLPKCDFPPMGGSGGSSGAAGSSGSGGSGNAAGSSSGAKKHVVLDVTLNSAPFTALLPGWTGSPEIEWSSGPVWKGDTHPPAGKFNDTGDNWKDFSAGYGSWTSCSTSVSMSPGKTVYHCEADLDASKSWLHQVKVQVPGDTEYRYGCNTRVEDMKFFASVVFTIDGVVHPFIQNGSLNPAETHVAQYEDAFPYSTYCFQQ